MLNLRLSKRNFAGRLSFLTRGFHPSASCRVDWMANNDILFNATTAMKRSNKPKSYEGNGKISSKLRQVTGNHNLNKTKKPFKKPGKVTIRWSTGSDRAKEAANSTIATIYQMNFEGNVKVINSNNNKMQETKIQEFAQGIDLNVAGFVIVDVDQIDEQTRIPLIKLVDSKVALKRYSDDMAKNKEKELIEMGVIKKNNVRSMDSDRGESSVKRIKISWEIKADDLCKQKARELVTQLKKGLKVHVYVGSKNSDVSKKWTDGFEDSLIPEIKLSQKEREQRSFVVDKILEIVEEYSIQPQFSGILEDKMLIKLSPKLSANKKMDKKALKEERKKERQEKLRNRIEKKKAMKA